MTYRVFVTMKNDVETVTRAEKYEVFRVDGDILHIGDLFVSASEFVYAEFEELEPENDIQEYEDNDVYTEPVPGLATGGAIIKPNTTEPWPRSLPSYTVKYDPVTFNTRPDGSSRLEQVISDLGGTQNY